MPQIRELNAPSDLGLRPDDRAAESTAGAGRRIAGSYSQIAEAKSAVAKATNDFGRSLSGGLVDAGTVAVKYMEHQEISKGAAESAKTLYSLDEKWNSWVKGADPNDPTLAAKFREEVIEPALEKMKDGYNTEGGQKFGESQVQSFRNHFFAKTTSDMARLAGVAAKQNVETMTNQLTNAVMSDPTSLRTSLDLADKSIGAMVDSSPNLKGADGSALKITLVENAKKEIVKAAAIGAINANPEAGLKQFSGPEYSKYISGTELKQLEQQAKTVERGNRVAENYALHNQKMFKQEASDAKEGTYLEKLHSDDPNERASVNAREISKDYTLTREARERMIGIVERETKPEPAAKISNATASDLISRIRAPSGDPRRIDSLDPVYSAYEKGELTKADLKFVRDEFTNLRTPEGQALGSQQDEFIKSVKPLIDKSNPLLGKIDQSGPQQVYQFTMALRKKVEEYRRAGKDPHDLMDPSKPDYMGSPAALAGFQKPLQQSLQDTAKALRTGGSGFPAADTITGVSAEGAPAATSTPKPAAAKPPEKGFIKDGYEFLGGSPGDARSWRRVGG